MSDEEIARFNVLFEHIDAKVTAIAESQAVVIARLDRHDERFDRLEARFDQYEARVEARFDRVEGRLDRLETKVDAIAIDLTETKGRVGRIEEHVGLSGARTKKRRARKRPRKH